MAWQHSRVAELELPPLPLPPVMLTKKEPVTLREAEGHHLLKALEATNWVVGGPFGLRLVSACHGRP
jgi:hypothetical protein